MYTLTNHFIANSPKSVDELKEKRLSRIEKALTIQAITVVIDETGNRNKSNSTDYVAWQYAQKYRNREWKRLHSMLTG